MPDGRLLASTVDVTTPVVDDPYHAGQVAAANSISDIYAMGGVPRFALSVLAYPPRIFGPETMSRVVQGAIDKAFEAEVVLGGGHTLRTQEVLFGLCVVGDFPSGRVLEKSGAKDGDLLIVTKPLGNGILVSAAKAGRAPTGAMASALAWMTKLNRTASRLAVTYGAHACTDVTGFGLLGHLGEMTRASSVGVELSNADVPVLDGVEELAEAGLVSGGTKGNLKSVEGAVRFSASITEARKLVLSDAQTSGGLLFALPEASLARFQADCAAQDQFFAIIGRFRGAVPEIVVE